MKIDFSECITDFKGNPVKSGDSDLTLERVVMEALLATYEDEARAGLGGEAKAKRFKIASLVNMGGVKEVSADDIVEIKKCVGKGWPAMVVGRAYELLEGAESPKRDPKK